MKVIAALIIVAFATLANAADEPINNDLATNAVAVLRVHKFYTWPSSQPNNKLARYEVRVDHVHVLTPAFGE